MNIRTTKAAAWLVGGLSVVAVGATLGFGAGFPGAKAWAAGHDSGGHEGGNHEGGGPGPGGPGGGHDSGHDEGHEGGPEGGGHEGGGHDGGSGGPPPGAGQGQGHGQSGGQGSAGGKPPWAQEGIPDVELGRLNVVRAPARVLDRAFAEAMNTMTPAMVSFYSQDLGAMESAFRDEWDTISIFDSPLQNLALLRDALDGTSDLASLGVTNDIDTLMAVFLGVASDKNVPISTKTVIAVTTILGYPMSEADAAALAADAETIRIAVLAGHG